MSEVTVLNKNNIPVKLTIEYIDDVRKVHGIDLVKLCRVIHGTEFMIRKTEVDDKPKNV